MRGVYMGVKLVEAEPEVRDGKEGYKIYYPDGYVSWSPADTFEKAYFELDNENLINAHDVENFHGISVIDKYILGEHGVGMRIELPTGKVLLEANAIDGNRGDWDVADAWALLEDRLDSKTCDYLRFVFAWAKNGLTVKENCSDNKANRGKESKE